MLSAVYTWLFRSESRFVSYCHPSNSTHSHHTLNFKENQTLLFYCGHYPGSNKVSILLKAKMTHMLDELLLHDGMLDVTTMQDDVYEHKMVYIQQLGWWEKDNKTFK